MPANSVAHEATIKENTNFLLLFNSVGNNQKVVAPVVKKT